MSLPRYPEYKDSGVGWLGRVPSHWQVMRLRFIAELNPPKSEVAALDRQTEVSFLSMDAIGDDGAIRLDETRTLAQVESGYTYFRDGDGDVVIAKITPCFENGKGAVVRGLLDGVGFGTTELIVVRPKPEVTTSDYLGWIFASPTFRKDAEGAMYGAGGQKRVPDSFVRDYLDAVPPMEEQSAIAAFLDRETAKIDALIAEQETLLALLAEKRQATISHAVTRGLDPDVPMKDSGIAWLGEVPAHWDVMQLRNIARIVRGASPRPAGDPRFFADDDNGEGNVPWLTVAEITKDESLYVDAVREYLTALGAEHSQHFERGLVVFSNSGATLGVPKILGIDCCANDGVLAFRDQSTQVDPEYLYCFLLTTTQRLRTEMKQGGGQPNLNTDIVKGIGFACPPLGEQSEIVEFLHEKFRRFEQLKDAAEHNVALLSERRSALVAAAVTGKIDVRGLVAAQAA